MIKEPTKIHEIISIIFLISVLGLFLYGIIYIVPNEKTVPILNKTTKSITPIPTPPSTPSPIITHLPMIYTISVDSDFGFYKAWMGEKVVNVSRLNISIGDTVTWVNDDDIDWDLAVSGFFGTHKLRYRYSYTFNETGKYIITVKARRSNIQTIEVKS